MTQSYLTTFERLMKAYEINTAHWAFKLVPQLTGQAQQAYAALEPGDAEWHPVVKAAIVQCYNINNKTHHQQFRRLRYKSVNSLTGAATKLTDLAGRWLKDCTIVEDVKDAVVKEQLLLTLPEDMRMWVKKRKPKTNPRQHSWQKSTEQDCQVQHRKSEF